MNKRVTLDTLKFSAPNQALGLAILFIAACVSGAFFCWLNNLVPVSVDYSFDDTQAYINTLSAGVLYFAQYFYFYFLYFVILGVLLTVSWRRSSTGVEAIIAFIVCFFVFLV